MPFGATILDPTGPVLTAEEKQFFRDADPYGFILFARHIETPDQIRALCSDLRDTVGRNAPILLDQEGGRVQRLGPPDFRQWDAPLDFAGRASNPVQAMYLRYAIIAAEMRSVGIDVNCAPLVDVADEQTHPFLRNRCYGMDAPTVAGLGRAVSMGLLAGGVLPVVKHMPGHGRARSDSHFDLPRVTAPLEALHEVDFAPFKVLNDQPMGMTAHIVYEALDPEAPATLSPRVMQVIRNDIGFDNLIMTDDISMKALSGSLSDLALGSLAAGCDVVLLCNASLEDRRAVAEAAGTMSPPAQTRAERALLSRPDTAPKLDIEELEAKLSALVDGPLYG
ncbi:glycoside hydrolase family 3 N-terminal domain-containing protein [Pseudooceanicola algae]|uniref:beta-N-acetylhexosaminidase n=1 Tax=Pseudooceanicola algae TaxID=1537215 RepID=A0A418SDM3_9RHOB|nr:glycoside hydrolase family 3 N-terminal domain-containing protein [Pseudooceanicola algae]QPM89455.1 Beta-hexosaminidase [Pseudooceanicola algae]